MLKYSKNTDQQQKRFLKICVWQKVMTKKNVAQIMAISFVFWPNFLASSRDPLICLDLHEIFVCVHFNIVEWALNPQEPFANPSHPRQLFFASNLYFKT
jgi:hypothetical protein